MARNKPMMLRGTLYTFRRKCGNKNYRCHRGELHESLALSYSVKGRTRLITLTPQGRSQGGKSA